jgi:hypothetical protein
MAFKTYLPALRFILEKSCRYIARYETQIRSHLPAGAAQEALTAVVTACQALIVFLDAAIPPAT